MQDKKMLFFDLDDTLIKCSGYYYDVEDIIADKIIEYNNTYTTKELKIIFNEKQWQNVSKHGYGPENFMVSIMQVGSELLGYDFYKDELYNFIKEKSHILFDSHIELIDGTEETIKHLYNQGYDMSIITKGNEEVQKRRIERLSINNYFKGYEIVKYKEKNDYLDILEKYKLNAESCYMIGNSPKGDINEAKLAGYRTIYIPNEHTWNYEDEEIINEGLPTIVLNNITELKEVAL